jgi:hypothetical protein
MRVCATHAWPLFMRPEKASIPAMDGTSTSSSTIAALLPPSSSDTRLRRSVASAPTLRPAAVDPVNETLSTPGWVTRYSLTARSAGSTDSTPSGSPASTNSSPSQSASIGVSGAGFRMTVQPASRAGTTLLTAMNSGTFQGMIAATTPTGSRRTFVSPNMPVRVSSHGNVAASLP